MNEDETVPLVSVSLEENASDINQQNVYAEVAETSSLMKLFWIISISFLAVFAVLSRLNAIKDLEPFVFPTKSQSDKKMFVIPFNSSFLDADHVFAALSIDIFPYKEKNLKPTGYKIRTSAVIDSGSLRYAENRISQKFGLNISRFPVFFTDTEKMKSFNLTITCQSNKDWAENIVFYWKTGKKSVFVITNSIHGVLLIILLALMLYWLKKGAANKSLRAKSVTLLLILAIISELPFPFIFGHVPSEVIREILSGVYFSVLAYFWRMKIARFDLKKIAGSSESRSMIIGGAMMAVIIYKALTTHLTLFSLPTSSDGQNPANADFLAKNLKELLICGFFYFILIDLLDTSEKMASEDSQAYLADNSVYMFATVAAVVMFLRKPKDLILLPNPVRSCLSEILWMLPLVYEVFASSFAEASLDQYDEYRD